MQCSGHRSGCAVDVGTRKSSTAAHNNSQHRSLLSQQRKASEAALAWLSRTQASDWSEPGPCRPLIGWLLELSRFWVPGLVTCLELRSWTLTLPRGLDTMARVSCIRTPIVRAAQCCCCCGGAVAYSLNPSPIHIGPQQFSNTLVMMILFFSILWQWCCVRVY